jgi:hypothetical protein
MVAEVGQEVTRDQRQTRGKLLESISTSFPNLLSFEHRRALLQRPLPFPRASHTPSNAFTNPSEPSLILRSSHFDPFLTTHLLPLEFSALPRGLPFISTAPRTTMFRPASRTLRRCAIAAPLAATSLVAYRALAQQESVAFADQGVSAKTRGCTTPLRLRTCFVYNAWCVPICFRRRREEVAESASGEEPPS